jgi:hypothetical protein
MITRRELLIDVVAAALTCPLAARGQQASKIPHESWIGAGS